MIRRDRETPRATGLSDDKILGAIGSPYSRKLRAVYRYRRIPHLWIHQGSPEAEGLPKPRITLLPQVIADDERGELEARVDSTPLIRALEVRFPGMRSVIPTDLALAFVDALIEGSFFRRLEILEDHLRGHRFVLGARPGAADFGLYGQLTQLALFDPTPMALTLERAPRVFAYADRVDDLSGLEPKPQEWFDRDALPETFQALLGEIGRCYAPFLLANAEALARGRERVECIIDGRPFQQSPFPYQGKCLEWLRHDYRSLSASDRAAVDRALNGSGCETLFA